MKYGKWIVLTLAVFALIAGAAIAGNTENMAKKAGHPCAADGKPCGAKAEGKPYPMKADGAPCDPEDCPHAKDGKPCDNPDCPKHKAGAAAAAWLANGYDKALKVGDQAKCATCGEGSESAVTAKTKHIELNGKHYYFCCMGCAQKFQKAHGGDITAVGEGA